MQVTALKHQNQMLVPKVEIAASLWPRTKGLLGRASLPVDQALLILRCNSVHTFFMKFAIDLVFVDRDLKIKKTFSRVKPGRLVLPVWGASHVFELSAGFLETKPLSIGEQLHVDHPIS